MKKTLLVTLLLALGPVAASAGVSASSDNGLTSNLAKACALQPGECAVVERRAPMF